MTRDITWIATDDWWWCHQVMTMVPFPNAGQHDDEQHEVHTCIFLYVGALCCLFCGGICRIICGGLPSGLEQNRQQKWNPRFQFDFGNEWILNVGDFCLFFVSAKWTWIIRQGNCLARRSQNRVNFFLSGNRIPRLQPQTCLSRCYRLICFCQHWCALQVLDEKTKLFTQKLFVRSNIETHLQSTYLVDL